ncbi:methylmalonyl-CoA mutase family protein [Priestia abyssalis]|uniref:methylmalonyl-CoA mutase family protein n=1 Tax=Priestia abyssalis TaxID=1221450 RepID=UPI0009950525|nr:methylmalonyl-CoA mutase family protein [Priestia abyssalis]
MKPTGGVSFDEFAAVSTEEWEKEVERTLKGKSVTSLHTNTYEEIVLKPLYLARDVSSSIHINDLPGKGSLVRGSSQTGYVQKAWKVAQEINHPLIEETNRLAVSALTRGQTMLAIQFDEATKRGLDSHKASLEQVGNGVPVSCLQDIEELLKDIPLEQTPLHMVTNFTVLPLLSLMAAYTDKKGFSMKDIEGVIGTDPLASLAEAGSSPLSISCMYKYMSETIKWANHYAPRLKTIVIDTEVYHNGGANAVQELAFAIATAVEYIDALLTEGLSLQEVLPHFSFTFGVGSELFMETAKLRAFKMLWTKMLAAFGGESDQYTPYIHAKTSRTTKTKYDAYTNMIRGTVEAFAAVAGGIDSLHVTPFDTLIQPSNEFSQRIARNTQLILSEEAYLTKVIDPAGGSWYVESLTTELAERAWHLFQQIEGKGGMSAALKQQFIQCQLKDVLNKRKKDVETRVKRVVGITHYTQVNERLHDRDKFDDVSFHEQRVSQLQAVLDEPLTVEHVSIEAFKEAFLKGATIGTLTEYMTQLSVRETIEPVSNWRKSMEFEELREKVEKRMEYSLPATVHLLVLGHEKECKTRIDLARSFFESGGFIVDQSHSLYSVHEAIRWCNEQEGNIWILCGTDELYEELGIEIIHELASAHNHIYVCGKQVKERRKAFINNGAKGIIEPNTNAFLLLSELMNDLEVN